MLLDLIQPPRDNDKTSYNDKDKYDDDNNNAVTDDGGCDADGLEQAFATMQAKVGIERQRFLELNSGAEFELPVGDFGDIQDQVRIHKSKWGRGFFVQRIVWNLD